MKGPIPPRMTRRAKILLLTLTMLILSASAASASSGEGCFTSSINGARSSAGVPPLATRDDLVAIARRHSARMAAAGEIFHNSGLASEAPDDWQLLGENVGRGPDCTSIHDAFMASASHRRNILDKNFNLVGVGVVVTADNTVFVTEVFMKSGASAPTATAPATPRTRRTAAPPKPRPSPSPSPPPPPGSLVTGQTMAYFLILETEEFPTDEEIAQYLRSKGSR